LPCFNWFVADKGRQGTRQVRRLHVFKEEIVLPVIYEEDGKGILSFLELFMVSGSYWEVRARTFRKLGRKKKKHPPRGSYSFLSTA
jgi:hypothetical protein